MTEMPQVYYISFLLIGASTAVYLAYTITKLRTSPGAWPLLVLMLAAAEWSVGYALELASAAAADKLFWAKVEYLGIVTVAPAWFVFALHYTTRKNWFARRSRRLALLAIVPVLTLLLAWTNETHGLIWSQVRFDASGPVLRLELAYGPGFWLHLFYSYTLLLLGSVWLAATLLRASHLYRWQVGIALLGTLAPWLGNALYVSGLSPWPDLDLTPFAFTIAGVAYAWSLFRLRFLEIVPVARQAVLDSLADSVVVLDLDGRIVDLNPAAQQFIGLPYTALIGRPAVQVFSTYADLVKQEGDQDNVRTEIESGSGDARRTYDLQISPLTDREQYPIGRLVVLRDVTHRKQAELVLQNAKVELELRVAERTAALQQVNQQLQRELAQRRRAEDRYGSLFEDAPVMYVITRNRDGIPIIAECNQIFLETLGYSRAEVLEKPLADLYAPGSRVELVHGYQRALEGRFDVEAHQLLTRHGQVVDTLLRAQPEHDEAGNVSGTRAMYLDVTHLKRAESQFRDLMESAPDAMIIVDQDGRIDLVNAQAEQLFGYPRQELVGRHMHKLLPEQYHHRHGEHMASYFADPRTRPMGAAFELYGLRRDGSEFSVEISLSPLQTEQGVLVSAAIRDVTQRKRTEQALRHLSEQRKHLLEVTQSMLSSLSMDQVISHILDAMQSIMRYDSCGLYWIDEEAGLLRPFKMVGQGLISAALDTWTIPLGQGIGGQVAKSGQGELVNDAHLDPRSVYPADAKVRREHLISVPVRVKGETVGVFNVSRIEDAPFTLEEFDLVQLFIAQAAIAIHNAELYGEVVQRAQVVEQQGQQLRLLARRLAEAQEAERKELARELHDQVGQNLTALDFSLNLIRGQLADKAAAPQPALSHLDDALVLLSETANGIRDVMAHMRPPVLDDYGLVAALRWHADRFVSPRGIKVQVQGQEPDPRLPARVELALFRITQEALNNVVKHAQAQQVTLSVETDPAHDMVRLMVADDGVGFEPAGRATPAGRASWGLMGMVERAEAAGAQCHIESSPGRGTQVIMEVAR